MRLVFGVCIIFRYLLVVFILCVVFGCGVLLLYVVSVFYGLGLVLVRRCFRLLVVRLVIGVIFICI